ncbi:MAG TPA: RDD family protein [Burkholderiaceae bacterium]|nr:RDD family protein [Burkholderiaceae bacterium]
MLDGRLSLTTPEGVRLLLTPAGPVPRAWAWAIDFVIWVACMIGFSILLQAVLGAGKIANGAYLLFLFATYWGYPIICEVYFGGRTIGKRALGIEVLRADGLPVGWRESTLRNLLLVADFLPLIYLAGLLCMLYDSQFRRLGDIVAGTQVVYRDKVRARAASSQAQPLPLPFSLTPEQQRTLADLFEREAQLPPARLAELGSVAEELTGQTGEESLERLRGFAAGLMQ